MDLPRAFFHLSNDDDNIMFSKSHGAELMMMVTPQIYHQYIVANSKDVLFLFARVQKVLCGMLKSVLLFYLKPNQDLKDVRFTINTYEPCIMNKIIDWKQIDHHLVCG